MKQKIKNEENFGAMKYVSRKFVHFKNISFLLQYTNFVRGVQMTIIIRIYGIYVVCQKKYQI